MHIFGVFTEYNILFLIFNKTKKIWKLCKITICFQLLLQSMLWHWTSKDIFLSSYYKTNPPSFHKSHRRNTAVASHPWPGSAAIYIVKLWHAEKSKIIFFSNLVVVTSDIFLTEFQTSHRILGKCLKYCNENLHQLQYLNLTFTKSFTFNKFPSFRGHSSGADLNVYRNRISPRYFLKKIIFSIFLILPD